MSAIAGQFGYEPTENSSYFLTRVGGLCLLGVVTGAIPGVFPMSNRWYLGSAAVTALAVGAWTQHDRATLAELRKQPLDDLLNNPQDLPIVHPYTQHALWTSGHVLVGCVVVAAIATLVAKRYLPENAMATLGGFGAGWPAGYGIVGLWHLCLQPKEGE